MTANNLNTAPVVAENGVVISNNDNTILGNPFYGYETNNDKKTRGVQQSDSVGETYINWQESNNFNIQDVIDNVLPLVLSQNPSDIPNIRLMCVPGVYDDNRGSHIERPLLCIPYTDKVQQAYRQVYGDETNSDNNKGVVLVEVDGRPEKFLVIGCTGYDDQNRQLAAFNNLRSNPDYRQALNDARQKNTKNPVIIPNIEYTFTKQGLTAGRVESTQGESRPISDLLANSESNPQHLNVESLGLGYVDANGTVVINDMPIQSDAQTKAMSDEAKQAKAGQYYLLVPNGKGYSKIFIEPPVLKPYSENGGKNKDAYHKSLKETMKTAIEAVRQSQPKHAKTLLSKFLYLYGDVKFDFGDSSNPVITITKQDGTVVVLNGQDLDKDFETLCNTGVRLLLSGSSQIKNQLIVSGLLTTDAKSLVCYNKTFAVKPIRQTQNSQPSSQSQQQNQNNQASTSARHTVKINGVEYQSDDTNFSNVTNPEIKNLCIIALRIQQNELNPIDKQEFPNMYKVDDDVYVLDDNLGLQKATEEQKKQVIEFLTKQTAEQSVPSTSTSSTDNNNQGSDPNNGFDSSQQGVNSNNAPVDVQQLRTKSAQILRDRNQGHKGKAVTTIAGLLVGDTPQTAKVGNTDVSWSETPGALPATQVGNIMDAFFRLCFQSDAVEFHSAAKQQRLATYFPNLTEDNLQKIYKRAMTMKGELMPDGEDNYEVIADELWLETTIPVDVNGEQRALLVQGKPDLIIRNKKTGKYIIADFKTKYNKDVTGSNSGNFNNNEYDAKTKLKYWYQLQLYRKALEDMGCQVENTRLIISGVNYSRAFNMDSYNKEGIYLPDGTFKPVAYDPKDNKHRRPLTPYYDNALNATTSDGAHPFNNAANQSTKGKDDAGVHYQPKPLEGDSTLAAQINDSNGNGVLYDTISNRPAEVQVGLAQTHMATELCNGQTVNNEMVLTAQILQDWDIEIPKKPYVAPKPRLNDRQLRKKLKTNGNLTNNIDIVQILNTALQFSNSTESLNTVAGITQALKVLLQFTADGKHINQEIIDTIKTNKKLPDFLTDVLRNLQFNDDNIHSILVQLSKLPEINVNIDNNGSETSENKNEQYQNVLRSSNYTLTIDGDTWTINNRPFKMTDDGLVPINDVPDDFIAKLQQSCPSIPIRKQSDVSNNTEITLTQKQQELADKGKNLQTVQIITSLIEYIKGQNQKDPSCFEWINSKQGELILKGWLQDNFPDYLESRNRIQQNKWLQQVKNKLDCFK